MTTAVPPYMVDGRPIDMENDPPDGGALRRLWITLAVVVIGSFAALLYYGGEVYQQAPPIPTSIVTTDGQLLFTGDQIQAGQDVWRSIGGQELGSIWGHGAYTAPDWTADWLHREAIWILDAWAIRDFGQTYESLNAEQQASLRARLEIELRTNTYDASTGAIEVSPDRAEAIGAVQNHFVGLFGSDPELDGLRESYAMPAGTVSTESRRMDLTAFIFWATWVCATERPGSDVTYTNNWPPEDLIGNRPTGLIILVSVGSFVLLLGGIGALAWFYAATRTPGRVGTLRRRRTL